MLKEAANVTQDSTVNVKQLFDLTGRVAIVTGGSIGLGRQMAEGLAEMGADLVLCARKKERCHQAAEELQQLGVKAIALGRSRRGDAARGLEQGHRDEPDRNLSVRPGGRQSHDPPRQG
jgi:NAD(P)-dependent dehydrogenase (short-subunit alcohol dehydrogenase family)